MTHPRNWMYIELRVPLFILAIGLSLRISKWVYMMTPNNWLQQLSFPLTLALLVLVVELTKLSQKRIHVLWAGAVILCGMGIEELIEPGDYFWLRDILSSYKHITNKRLSQIIRLGQSFVMR